MRERISAFCRSISTFCNISLCAESNYTVGGNCRYHTGDHVILLLSKYILDIPKRIDIVPQYSINKV